MRRSSLGFVIAGVVALSACTVPPPAVPPAPTTVPAAVTPSGDPLLPAPLDCEQWRYDGVADGQLPPEWDPDEDKFTARRDAGSARSPHRCAVSWAPRSIWRGGWSAGRPTR